MDLALSPPDLGPVRATVTVASGSLSVALWAAHPQAQAVISDGLPELSRMLAAAGHGSVQVRLSGGQAGEGGQHPFGRRHATSASSPTRGMDMSAAGVESLQGSRRTPPLMRAGSTVDLRM